MLRKVNVVLTLECREGLEEQHIRKALKRYLPDLTAISARALDDKAIKVIGVLTVAFPK